jgi:hypothetical protein
MSTNQTTFNRTTPPPRSKGFTEYDATTFDRNHQQFLFVKNRILNLLDFGNKATRTTNGIHGLMNGAPLPLFKAHKYAARQLDYKGDDENADQHMSRAFAALDAAEQKCGRQLFEIRRADGVTQFITSYERDYLGETVKYILLKAKNLPDYGANPSAAITDELLWEGINKKLPEKIAKEKTKTDGASITDDAIIKATWTRAETTVHQNMMRIEIAGGNSLREVEQFCERLKKMAQAEYFSKRMKDEREKRARQKRIEAADTPLLDRIDTEHTYGKNISDNSEAVVVVRNLEPMGSNSSNGGQRTPVSLTPPPPDEEKEEVAEVVENTPLFDSTEEAALMWAARGVPIIPLFSVDENGHCRCKYGATCRTPGKHPQNYHGLTEASTEPRQILKWFRKYQNVNIAGATGEVSGLLVFDVDPRHGGDLSLTDLIESYGDEWLETLKIKTGSGGYHFYFEFPKGINLRNTVSIVAPGIDTRANRGYVVLPPSNHESGKCYELINDVRATPPPAWLLEILVAHETKGSRPPAKVIDFQVKERSTDYIIPEGQRNDRLRDIACGRWTHGYASTVEELYQQMIEVRDTRCEPGKDSPATDEQLWDLAQRTVRKFPCGNVETTGASR